jgi:hypothetical protein
MAPDNIRRLVDFIDACYPARRLFVQSIKEHWAEDAFLLEVDLSPEEKNTVKTRISEHGDVPTLSELRHLIRTAKAKHAPVRKCDVCNGSGWLPTASEFDIVDGEHVGMVERGLNRIDQVTGKVKPTYYRVTKRCTFC